MNTTTTDKKRTDVPNEPTAGSVLLFLGVALVVLGLIALGADITFTLGTILVMGALLIAAAVAEFVHAYRARGQRGVGVSILSGIIYLVTGALLLWNPVLGAISVTAVIGSFLLVAGIVRIVRAVRLRRSRNWGWMLATGVLDIILGIIIWSGWPATGLWIIGLFIGIELIFHGFACIGLGLAAEGMFERKA